MALRHELQPMLDYQKAKRLVWNPADVDLKQDARDWLTLKADERDVIQRLLSMFIAGEEAVAGDLAPLLWALGSSGDLLEEELFVTAQIFEEALHVEFFHRWFEEVVPHPVDHASYWGPCYRALFYDELLNALQALLADRSPRAMLRAYLVYHMIVEGVLAETGYQSVFLSAQRRGLLPGLVQGITLIKRDESRHIAYGIYALQRLLRANPDLWDYFNEETNRLLEMTIAVIPEALLPYGDDIPFGIRLEEMVEFAADQFTKRYNAVERVMTK